jgi:hypothetical protein
VCPDWVAIQADWIGLITSGRNWRRGCARSHRGPPTGNEGAANENSAYGGRCSRDRNAARASQGTVAHRAASRGASIRLPSCSSFRKPPASRVGDSCDRLGRCFVFLVASPFQLPGVTASRPCHVSSPRYVERSMEISHTTLTCLLRLKAYAPILLGRPSAVGRRTRWLLNSFKSLYSHCLLHRVQPKPLRCRACIKLRRKWRRTFFPPGLE